MSDGERDRRQEKRYWRSLERLLESPAVAVGPSTAGADPALDREFPPGAAEPPDALTRRTMLGLMGSSFGLAGLVGCRRPVEHIVPFVEPPERAIPGIPSYYATTLPFGTSAYGVVVESHDGRPTKLDGNPRHPASGGAASAWMQAATLDLYDPDRARGVRRRERAAEGSEGEEASLAAPEVAAEGHGEVPGDLPDTAEDATWDDFAAAWQAIAEEEDAAGTGGAGIAFVAAAWSSPTQSRLVRRLRERFPRARWAVHEPLGEGNVFAGLEQATGRAQRPVHHFDRARVVVALDADPLMTEAEALANARGFAAGRRPAGEGGEGEGTAEPLRLYSIESTPSVTGMNADHRLRLRSRDVGAFAAALAAELGAGGGAAVAGGALPAGAAERARIIARDLRTAGPRALVVVGRRQPPAVHALVHRIHQALGALGTTVELGGLEEAGWGGAADLEPVAAAIAAGEVHTLVVLGANPALTAPRFWRVAGRVPHLVHLSAAPDETAATAHWHLPLAHPLESWGDARAADGTASIVQPLIAPLYQGRSTIEVLALLAGEEAAGHALVRETWSGLSETAWRRALHDGLIGDGAGAPAPGEPGEADPTPAGEPAGAGDAPAPVPTAPAAPAAAVVPAATRERTAAGGDALELVLVPSASVFDGRFSNSAWLQELPDPVTKLTWGNAALVSPATAAELGLETGRRVRLAVPGAGDDAAVEAPVLVQPGQADGSIALAVGYGRRAAGRVGDGVGVDAFPLWPAGDAHFTAVTIERAAGETELTQTQEHWAIDTRLAQEEVEERLEKLVRTGTWDEFRADPHFAADHPHFDHGSLWEAVDYDHGHQWGMTIDLNACIGCGACVAACQAENNVPVVGAEQVRRGREMHWLRVDRYYAGPADDPEFAVQPIPCMHCETAPCEQVCPVAATVHDREGLNTMAYNRCIGTRYCSNNCPYKVRRFNFFNYTGDTPELTRLAMNPDVTVRSRGVMEKCSYCVQRLTEGKIEAKRAGRALADGDVQTACQQTCPTRAITFGDLNMPESEVRRAKEGPRNYVLLGDLHTKPRTSYLARLRNPNPEWPGADRPVSGTAGAGREVEA